MVVEAELGKLRGAVETLAKCMRHEVDASAEEKIDLDAQVDKLQDQVTRLGQDLERRERQTPPWRRQVGTFAPPFSNQNKVNT